MDTPLLSKYITHKAVLKRLIDMRCAKALARQKKTVVLSLSTKRINKEENSDILYDIFPPRRQWVHSGKSSRIGKTQIAKNERNLKITYRKESSCNNHANWYKKLENYVDSIIKKALNGSFVFGKPKVCFIIKEINNDRKEVVLRPICKFETLEERIIGSLYNKILTHLFDCYFYENSFAFRAPREGQPISHLNAVNKIIQFRKEHCDKNIWVAECDMKKFFDTIDHEVIIQLFVKLLWRCRCDSRITKDEFCLLLNIMISYVDCFSFKRDVLDGMALSCVAKQLCAGGICPNDYNKQIQWVEEEIEKLRQKDWPYPTQNYEVDNLGVPQGGALSGLIANIVMNEVDVRLNKYYVNNSDFLYVRFCDDMIMMGIDKETVSQAFECYKQGIKELHLFIHDDVDITLMSKKEMSTF